MYLTGVIIEGKTLTCMQQDNRKNFRDCSEIFLSTQRSTYILQNKRTLSNVFVMG
jgi:hypothetical protein